MTDSVPTPKRRPQVFETGDPAVILEPALSLEGAVAAEQTAPPRSRSVWRPGWGAALIGALFSLAGLAASLWFAQFIAVALTRTDWIGTIAWSLLGVAAMAAIVLAGREIVGLLRLNRLARLRVDADAARRTRDVAAERRVVRRLRASLAERPELARSIARFKEHESDVRDAGDLLALAERELLLPIDAQARRLILASAKRVSLVTAMSPIAVVSVGFVLVENLKMLRALAGLYGGRPGALGGFNLLRMVFVHLLATSGVALTDDLIGQFIGQDFARRLSRRLGEGLFNGAMTARVGAAGLDVCRPLPFIEATPVRVRDILVELTRRTPNVPAGPAGA